MRALQSTGPYFPRALVAWGLLVGGAAAGMACASTKAAAVQPQTDFEMLSGIRPECVPPPKSFAVADRADVSCIYVPNGPASCTYVAEIAFESMWACGVGLLQRSCGEPWIPVRMECTPWRSDRDKVVGQKRQE
jgi:hypothetical protein